MIEERIFGPLTLKQFVTVAVGFGLSYLAYSRIPAPLAYAAIAIIVAATVITAFIRFNPGKIEGDLKQYFLNLQAKTPPADFQKMLQRKLAELESQIQMRASRGLPRDPKLEEVKNILQSVERQPVTLTGPSRKGEK